MKNKITVSLVIRNIEEIIATTAVVLMLVICYCNVFARYVLRSAISWSDEVCVCLLAWTTFVGAAAAYKRNLHYGMDFLMDHLPAGGKRTLRIIINLFIVVSCAFLAWHSLQFTMKAVKVMPFSRLSYKWIDASAVVGFVSMTIYSTIYLIQAFAWPEKFDARYQNIETEEEDRK